MSRKYDIFISYRRDDGRQYARLVEKELVSRGFRIFLDYEELKDGIFKEQIASAIKSADIFLMILTPLYLDRCGNEQDWVRKEITLAADAGKHFIPLVPDHIVTTYSDSVTSVLPETVRRAVLEEQWSEVSLGQTMESTFTQMVNERIKKYVCPRKNIYKRFILSVSISLCLVLACLSVVKILRDRGESLRQTLMSSHISEFPLNWKHDITVPQIKAVNEILSQMIHVNGADIFIGVPADYADAELGLETPQIPIHLDPFFIGQYEVSTYQWCSVMGVEFKQDDALTPITNVSYEQCEEFAKKLTNLSGICFSLPTEAEWEYAAKGGGNADSTLYSGRNDVREVAWYKDNSGGIPHLCDASNSRMYCNGLDLFDMSGNVSEWCKWISSKYRLYSDMSTGTLSNDVIYNDNIQPHRGGSFVSDTYQLTTFHREFADKTKGYATIGLRLVIHTTR